MCYIKIVRIQFFRPQIPREGSSCAYRARTPGGEEKTLKDGCYNVKTFARKLTQNTMEVIVGSIILNKVLGALPTTLHSECVA